MCTQPHLVKTFTLKNGKTVTKYFPHEFVSENPQVDLWRNELKIRKRYGDVKKFYVGEVGCGQCIECRLQKSRDWANRCMIEAMHHDIEKCFFVTLTYENSRLLSPSLVFDDVNNFVLRLRENQRYKFNLPHTFRYTLCGEYGDQFMRPHFHLLLFNYDSSKDSQEYLFTNPLGDILYKNPVMEKIWDHRGFITVGRLNWNTCAYVARYVVKKLKGKDSVFYEENDLVAPDLRMSNRPGIGLGYLTDFYDQLDFIESFIKDCGINEEGLHIFNDYISLPQSNGLTTHIPNYFVRKLEEAEALGMPLKIDLDAYKNWRHSLAEMKHDDMIGVLELDERDYFAAKEKSLEKQMIGQHRNFLVNLS